MKKKYIGTERKWSVEYIKRGRGEGGSLKGKGNIEK